MSAKLTPFDKLRRKRARKRFIRRFTIIVVLGIVIYFGCVVSNTSYYHRITDILLEVVQNVKRGPGYPVELNASSIKGCTKMGKSVVVLSDDIISVINKSGYRTLYDKHKLLDPRAIANSKKTLIYDQGGNRVNLYSRTKRIFDYKFQYPIFAADLSYNDRIAVAIGSNRYLSELQIWDNDYKKVFCWNSAEKYITSVSFSPNGNEVAVACLGVENGTYKSTLMLFNINKENETAKIEVNDDIILSAEYKSSNSIYVIYGHKANVIDSKGNIKSEYNFGSKKLIAFNNKMPKYMNLIFDNYDRLANNKLVVVDSSCKEVSTGIISGQIRGIDVQNNNIYVLKDDSVDVFNVASELIETYDIDMDVIDFIATSSNLYTVSNSKINIAQTDKNSD